MVQVWLSLSIRIKWFLVLVLLLSACENPNQVRERKYFSLCPPNNACLSPYFAINRLQRDVIVRFDVKKKRFVQTAAADPQGIVLHPGAIVDFWRVPQYVVATPDAQHAGATALPVHPTPGGWTP